MYHRIDRPTKFLYSDGESEIESSSSDETDEESTTAEFEKNRVLNLIRHNAIMDRLSNIRERNDLDSDSDIRPQNYDSDDSMTDVTSLDDEPVGHASNENAAQSPALEERVESESESGSESDE